MKNRTLFFSIAILVIAFIAASCEQNDDLFNSAEIHGEVEYNDTLYVGATVNLFSDSIPLNPYLGHLHQTMTDHDGKFDFDGLSASEYYIYAFLIDGHDTLSNSVMINISTHTGTYEADIHIESEEHVD